jgi:hypothetical protein
MSAFSNKNTFFTQTERSDSRRYATEGVRWHWRLDTLKLPQLFSVSSSEYSEHFKFIMTSSPLLFGLS